MAVIDLPRFGRFGLDLLSIDRSIRPGDDFYRYAEGRWLESAKIPPDRKSWGVFDELADRSAQDVMTILESAGTESPPLGTNGQKMADYYAAHLDTARIDRLGLTPARPWMDAIASLSSHAQVAALVARPGVALNSPIRLGITLDEKNPDRYLVRLSQSGLSLPDRDYYLRLEPQFVEIRGKFQLHVERMLTLVGQRDARREAAQILKLETEIAKLHWERAKRRERELTYNLLSLSALQQGADSYPWEAAFRSAGLLGASSGIELQQVVVAEWSAVPHLAQLFVSEPVSTWRSYLLYHFLSNQAPVLPQEFDEEHFDFHGRILNGQPERRARWKSAVAATNEALGEAVGERYVARYFPPESKEQVEQLVSHLRKAFALRIVQNPWMTAVTKELALEKLEAFRAKVGYPTKWRDYSRLIVKPDDAFGNCERAKIFEWERQLARLDKPTDRDEWTMLVQEVNAYYDDPFNEVVFPAALLQPPFFDPRADAAVNYGAIGGVIGHEMGHGFDDQGAKSDARGVLRTWWRQEDLEAFRRHTDALVIQYSQFEPIKGLYINGRLTLGENIGDVGGLSIAHDAYRFSLEGAASPVVEGLTGDQRFFLSWAQVWRSLSREEALRNQILSDFHSPKEFRVNGVVRNVDAWYEAFNVRPDDKLYLDSDSRVSIW